MSGVTSQLLELRASGGRYYAPRSHVDRLEILRPAEAPVADDRGRPIILRELGPLLGVAAGEVAGRRQALTVALRRRSVALLVDRVETLELQATVRPLAPLIARRLVAPWVLGAVDDGDSPIVVLDLRRIAADVALGAV
jgi:chemotaxis signal transduction protein